MKTGSTEYTEIAQAKVVDNHTNLRDKKIEVLALVQQNVSKTEAPNKDAIAAKIEEKLPTELSSAADLTKAIKQLNERKDARVGIVNTTIDGVRIRDARGQLDYLGDDAATKLKEDMGEKYAMQILNQVRAGILLLDQEKNQNEEAKAKLYLLAEQALKDIDKLPKQIEAYNGLMVSVLKEAGIQNPAERLNFAKEITSFQDEHTHIATVSNYNGHTNIELDIKLDPLSKDQKIQYESISKWDGKSVVGVPWFDKLEEYKKKLIQGQAANIASGEKVIPAQLRELAGLRNAYQKTTALQKKDDTESKVVVSSIHSGAPASKAVTTKAKKTLLEKVTFGFYKSQSTKEAAKETKERRQAIANENMNHLASYAQDGQLNANNLTTKTVGFDRGENWITKQVKKAAKGTVSFTASPINHFRLWFVGGRDHTQFEENLKLIADQLKENKIDGTENIQKFLRGDKNASLEEVKKELQGLEGLHLKQGLDNAINAKQLVNKSNSFGDNENNNLEASAAIAVLDTQVKSGGLSSLMKGSEYKESAHFCKSGKDRTGLVMLKASEHGISSALGVKTQEDRQNIAFVLAAAGHTQEMAGVQGGTVGNHSIKTSGQFDGITSGEFTLSNADGHLEGIINQQSSGFNSKIKTNPKKKNLEAYMEALDSINGTKVNSPAITPTMLKTKREAMNEHIQTH